MTKVEIRMTNWSPLGYKRQRLGARQSVGGKATGLFITNLCYSDHHENLTVRDLRYDFPKIEAILRGEQEILITKHNKPFATLMKPRPPE